MQVRLFISTKNMSKYREILSWLRKKKCGGWQQEVYLIIENLTQQILSDPCKPKEVDVNWICLASKNMKIWTRKIYFKLFLSHIIEIWI